MTKKHLFVNYLFKLLIINYRTNNNNRIIITIMNSMSLSKYLLNILFIEIIYIYVIIS